MGKIKIKLVRRHVWTFCHEAHVAQCAGINDALEGVTRHAIDFAGLGLVDQIEELGKAVAEVEAASAAVTDVKDAPQFLIEFLAIKKIRIVPRQGMARRCAKTAFSHIVSSLLGQYQL
jgi:hypothetical protein